MTELESSQEILKLLHELNITIKSIDSKLDNEVNEVNEVDIDESSGDVHISRKRFRIETSIRFPRISKPLGIRAPRTFKSESESESESQSLSKSEKWYRHSKKRI